MGKHLAPKCVTALLYPAGSRYIVQVQLMVGSFRELRLVWGLKSARRTAVESLQPVGAHVFA